MQKQCIHDKKIYKKWLKTMTTIEEKITRANKFPPFLFSIIDFSQGYKDCAQEEENLLLIFRA